MPNLPQEIDACEMGYLLRHLRQDVSRMPSGRLPAASAPIWRRPVPQP